MRKFKIILLLLVITTSASIAQCGYDTCVKVASLRDPSSFFKDMEIDTLMFARNVSIREFYESGESSLAITKFPIQSGYRDENDTFVPTDDFECSVALFPSSLCLKWESVYTPYCCWILTMSRSGYLKDIGYFVGGEVIKSYDVEFFKTINQDYELVSDGVEAGKKIIDGIVVGWV